MNTNMHLLAATTTEMIIWTVVGIAALVFVILVFNFFLTLLLNQFFPLGSGT